MNIQNVQIQVFLERIQSKVMRKIEDEFYCGTLPFSSQDQLDAFKQAWQLKLKQQFAHQNNSTLNKSAKIPFQGIEDSKQNATKNLKIEHLMSGIKSSVSKHSVDKTSESDLVKEVKKIHRNDNDEDEDDDSQEEDLLPVKKMKIEKKEGDSKLESNESKKEPRDGTDIDFLALLEEEDDNKVKNISSDNTKDSKKYVEDDFQLNSEDLDDVSDQVISEDYFQNFDNVLVGFITKERKTKKRSKQGNQPLASIDFSHLLGTINSQEILISSLRANFIDCRK